MEGEDPFKVENEDLATPGCLRVDRVWTYVGDSQSWVPAPREETL